jgi:hypothetical protein
MTVRTAAYRDRINQRGLGNPKLGESSSPQVPGSVHLCFVQGEPMNNASVTKRHPSRIRMTRTESDGAGARGSIFVGRFLGKAAESYMANSTRRRLVHRRRGPPPESIAHPRTRTPRSRSVARLGSLRHPDAPHPGIRARRPRHPPAVL